MDDSTDDRPTATSQTDQRADDGLSEAKSPFSVPAGVRDAMRFAGAGMELGGSAIVGAAIGYGVDRYLGNTTLLATALGAILGFTGGLIRFIRLALEASRPPGGRRSGKG
jgi:F0F1-type ATP synthase assembly protein I